MAGTGGLALRGEGDGVGLLHPGGEVAWGGHSCSLPSTYGKVFEKMEPGASQRYVVGYLS